MTRREAVLQTLAHRETVPVPYHLEFTQQALQKLVEYTGDPAIESGMGGYLHYGQYWGWPTELPEKPGYFRAEFGGVWNRTGADRDIGVIDEPLIADLADCDYRFPEPDIARLRGDIEALLRTRQDRFTFFGFGFCMFERAWSLMGMENTLANMILYPEELEKLLDGICDYMLRLVDVALEYDIDAVYFGDDWGQQRGLIMGYSLLSKSQMDVRPSVQKRLRTMAFSRVSTGDSDIPSSCEMKDEPAFKALQGKPAFF